MSFRIEMADLDRFFETYAVNAGEVVLVAPYVKVPTTAWLLSLFDEHCRIRLLTRARLEDFVFGASDIECWPMIWARGGEVYVEQSLHAKYFRFDDTVFFGSANATESALNRSVRPNLELLASHPFDDAFRETEVALFAGRIRADKPLYKNLKSAVERYRKDAAVTVLQKKVCRMRGNYDAKLEVVPLPDWWCFQTKRPTLLWATCCEPDSQLPSEKEAARADLRLLRIVPEEVPSSDVLHKIMAARLRSWSVVQRLHKCFDENETPDRPYLRYGFIRDIFDLEDDMSYGGYEGTVNAFFDWMIEFLPKEFFEAPRRHARLLGRHRDGAPESGD